LHGDRLAERRAHERRRVAIPATVETDDEPPVGCRTVDLSLGGALLETPTLLGPHVVVVLLLDGDGSGGRRLIPVEADVVDQRVDAEAGCVVARVAFRRMTRGGRARLAGELAALSPAG
jgi:hypothetical protein